MTGVLIRSKHTQKKAAKETGRFVHLQTEARCHRRTKLADALI